MTAAGEPTVRLKPGRDKAVRRRHPWVYGGAIAAVEGAQPGGSVVVRDSGGGFLARGYYNPRSQIVVRLLTWDEDERDDAGLWRCRLAAAVARREALGLMAAEAACRVVHAEADGLPGLVVDRYGRYLVLQALTLGVERRKAELVSALVELLRPAGVYERSDVDVRRLEGLGPATGVLWGASPPADLGVVEHGLRLSVDLLQGHKTGLYLDQRENRLHVAERLVGREVLDAFCYTGGFGLQAAARGARAVLQLDSSAAALEAARENVRRNGLEARCAWEHLEGDAFSVLRALRDRGRTFDAVVLDPPKFAFSRAQVAAAARGYKDINLLAMHLLRPGGLLCTFSCSGSVSEDFFQKILFGASLDAGREARILERLGQAADHPVLLTFPESAYLKGLVLEIA